MRISPIIPSQAGLAARGCHRVGKSSGFGLQGDLEFRARVQVFTSDHNFWEDLIWIGVWLLQFSQNMTISYVITYCCIILDGWINYWTETNDRTWSVTVRCESWITKEVSVLFVVSSRMQFLQLYIVTRFGISMATMAWIPYPRIADRVALDDRLQEVV